MKLSFPTKKLKPYIKQINGKYKNSKDNKNIYEVYGVTNIEGITKTGKAASADLNNYIIVGGNNFVFNPYRVNVGSIGLSDGDFIGLVSPAYVVFKTTEDLSSEFLYYYLKSPLGINLIKWYGDRGGVRNALRFKDLGNIDIPDLSYEQQALLLNKFKAISNLLDQYSIERNKQLTLSNDLRQSILQIAVQGKLVPQDSLNEPATVLLKKIAQERERLVTQKVINKGVTLPEIEENEKYCLLPDGWAWSRLVDICQLITDGTHQTPNYTESGRPFLSARNIKPFKFMPDNHRYVSEDDYQGYIKNRKPEIDDVLLTRVGSGIGEAAIIDQEIDFAFYVSIGLIRPFKNYIDPNFLVTWLNAPIGRRHSSKNTYGKGTSQGNLNLNLIRKFALAIPPLEEQKRIVVKVDQLMKLCNDLESKLNKSQKDSEILMQAVLQEAVGQC